MSLKKQLFTNRRHSGEFTGFTLIIPLHTVQAFKRTRQLMLHNLSFRGFLMNHVGIKTHLCLRGSEVTGQLAAQLLHGQMCMTPPLVNLQASR